MGLGALRLPGRDCRRVETVPKARDDTTDNEGGQLRGSTLEDGTDDHDRRAPPDGLATSKPVTQPDTDDCTEETTDIVRSNGDACIKSYC